MLFWTPSVRSTRPDVAHRRWRLAVILLATGYFIAGVFGRFPWKADEPYSFGMVWSMLQGDDWVVPQIAGQPFIEKPPLVYWLGALSARLVPWVPAHESSRLAVLLLVTLGVVALYRCAIRLYAEAIRWREWLNTGRSLGEPACGHLVPDARSYGLLAVLLVPGTLGFSEHIHKLTADVGQLAGASIALGGLVAIGTNVHTGRTRRSAVVGSGIALGTGAGVAFLSKGLLIPGTLAATVLMCLLLAEYRTRAAAIAFAAAVLAALPWMLWWPFEFYRAAPDLFFEWLITNNIGRFLGWVSLGGNVSLTNKISTVLLAGMPPLLLCAVVIGRTWAAAHIAELRAWTVIRDAPGHMCVALYAAASLAILFASSTLRDNYLLPVLPALILLGLPAVIAQPLAIKLERVLDVSFGVAAVVVALIWVGLVVDGSPAVPSWMHGMLGRALPLPFPLTATWAAPLATAAVVFAWLVARHDGLRSPVVAWSAGMAMLWIVLNVLLLPWIDAARSYQQVFGSMASHMQRHHGCVATLNLGESEVAMLEYVTGVRPTRAYLGHSGTGDRSKSNPAAEECSWLLVLSNRASGPLVPCPDRWVQAWTGTRPGDRKEQFALYHVRSTGQGSRQTHPTQLPVLSASPRSAGKFDGPGVRACEANAGALSEIHW